MGVGTTDYVHFGEAVAEGKFDGMGFHSRDLLIELWNAAVVESALLGIHDH